MFTRRITLGWCRSNGSAGCGRIWTAFHLETYGFAAKGSLRSAVDDLVSETGFRHLVAQTQDNTDGASLDMLNRQFLIDRSNSFHKLRFSQRYGDLADILFGGYYFNERSFSGTRFRYPLLGGRIICSL